MAYHWWPVRWSEHQGYVVPGGADYAVSRSGDGIWEIDALYRLLTDDGVTIIIHNYGIWIGGDKYRLTPEFWAPEGKYGWLNKGVFVCTLSDVPPGYGLANGPNENDRLLQVYRVY